MTRMDADSAASLMAAMDALVRCGSDLDLPDSRTILMTSGALGRSSSMASPTSAGASMKTQKSPDGLP
ncbi:hypothetical protein [Sorangium sp. So ce117]|uniref:hypothetical protein n=1 Tax=Sorangium sp. So ce117 TaxID=3133277 RepID=UPI003F5E4F92